MAAHPISPPLTADEFARLYAEDEGDRYELIDGEVCERTPNGYTHDRVKNNLKKLFDRADVDSRGFECWIEHSFSLSGKTIVTPDVLIIRAERLAHRKGNAPTAGAPEIAMEVAISDSSIILQRKVSSYLRNGAEAVCYVYPDLRKIVIYTAHEWRELSEGELLEFPALLPGVAIPVSAVFEGLED